MRITQQDIARIACVSQATVSRVLSGDDRVETEIRDRVLVAMHEHNYRPDVRARSLRKKRTHLIGLVVMREQGGLKGDPFFATFISEILECLSATPYHLCVDIATSASDQELVYDQLLRTRRVDGAILVESKARDDRIARLQADAFPFVLVGNPLSDWDVYSVDNDNELAGQLATKHLIDQGYRRVGMIAGPVGLTVGNDRTRGYRNVLSEFGMTERVWHCDFGFDAAREVAQKIFRDSSRPDALLVLDDFMALGVVQAARDLGLRIPQDVGVVGFNDTHACSMLEGGLTSVSLNLPLLVARAVSRLLQIVDGDEPIGERKQIVPCELHVRGSSLKVAGGMSL